VGLIFIGFRDGDLEKHGLTQALAGDPVLEIAGGHNHAGGEAVALDLSAIADWIDQQNGISAFAVASQFATRNPAHELAVLNLLREKTGKPVSLSHQLSAKLNGPRRALTALLNARLIGLIDRLLQRAQCVLSELGVDAPLMVVRGDGALISLNQARDKPIETILSGPAASIVGARWLTNSDNALVSDIGGTTTDIAVLRDGLPAIDPEGAKVGPYRTMVEAVAMRTFGLGGDSEVHFVSQGLQGGVLLGPRRVLPVSLAAMIDPDVVHAALDAQLRTTLPGDYDARFVRRIDVFEAGGLSARDEGVYNRITSQFQPIGEILKTRIEAQALMRLVSRGLVQISALTPSDASHALGRVDAWDADAAEKALLLFMRRRTGSGELLSDDPKTMAQIVIDQLTHQTALAILETAFAEDAYNFELSPQELANHIMTTRGLARHRGLLRIDLAIDVPVVGLGASAPSYYPAVGEKLGCPMVLSEHAGVANAIGAVVGRVTFRKSATITSPSEGLYRVHFGEKPHDFAQSEDALAFIKDALYQAALSDAKDAGAEQIEVSVEQDIKLADIENRKVFVEATVTATAKGRPRVAH
jgi:N-methylhydantoinase A/oxoprolinase/acetone carboxylase beta subunit